MNFFTGEYKRILEQGRRLRLPFSLVRELKILKYDKLLGYPMIVTPTLESLSVYPFSYFQNSDICQWLRKVLWTKEIDEIVSHNRIYPSIPFYKSDKISEKVREAVKILKGKIEGAPKTLRNLSGKNFEKLLYEILAFAGMNVQANVHILAAEIDLLLLELNEDGKVEFTIIECKHRGQSQKVVNINQVMRLYGLREALKKDFYIKTHLCIYDGFLS